MKKNKSQSKSSDNVRKSTCETLANQIEGNAKKGRKVQKKKKLKTITNREIFKTVLPGICYSNGQWFKKKTIEMMDVSVMKCDFEDLEGIGNERLVLWKMSAEETEELKQQVKQEALHKKRENIMPLVLQMSKDQIETAYEGIVKLWNIPDNLPSEECEDKNNGDYNTCDEEIKDEEQLSINKEKIFSIYSSGCDIMPSSECSKTDDKNCNIRSSTDNLMIHNDGKLPIAEMEFYCDSVGIVHEFASTEIAGMEPSNGDKSRIVLHSLGKSPVTTQPKPNQCPEAAFIAPLLIENSLVSTPNKLGVEVSRKFQDINCEVAKNEESIGDKYHLDGRNCHSIGNQPMLCSMPDNIVTIDHSFTNIRTTNSAAANDARSSGITEMKNDLNLCPKLVKRKRSTKAEYAKKMKFYVDDLSCLVSESLKSQSPDVSLTTDYASDKNATMTQTNTCSLIDYTIDQIAQAVASSREPDSECTASIKECSTRTSISVNSSCDVKKSWNNKTETQTKDLSVDPRRSQNRSNDQSKSLVVHENVVSVLKPVLDSESVSNLSKPDLGRDRVKNVSKRKNMNGSYCRKDHKQRKQAHTESRHTDSDKGCDRNFELVQKNHLNLTLDKKTISGKVSDKTLFEPVTKSRMHRQVIEKDLHLTEDLSQHTVLSSKECFNECLKVENVSEMTALRMKHKANTRDLHMQSKRKMKAVIPLNSELKQEQADKLSNHVSEQDKVCTNSNVQKVITANHVNRYHVKAVKNKGKREMANNLKLCQPQVCEYNTRSKKTSQKSGPCDIEADVSSRSIDSSTTMCNLGQTGGNNKTKDGNQDSDLHQTEHFIAIDKGKVIINNIESCQSEIIGSCSTNFTSNHLDHCYAVITQNIDNNKLYVSDSGPSQTEIIDSCKAKDLGLLQIEVTGVESSSKEDKFRDISMNHKSSKSSAVLHTISAKARHEKTLKRTYIKLNKTELDHTNRAPNDLGKNLNDKIQDSETRNDTEMDKLKELTMDSMKQNTSKHDSQKEETCSNTAVAQIDANILSLNSFPVTEKLVVHAADDLRSRSSNHDTIHHDAVSLNICSSAVEEQMKGDQTVSVHDECKQKHDFCTPENSFCHHVSELMVPRDTNMKESHCPSQLMAVDDSIVSRNEHLLFQSKDDNSEVKYDSCTSSDVSKNDCLMTRSGNCRLLDYSNSSNSELPESGHLLSVAVVSSVNNNYCNKTISPIHSPASHSSSSKMDPQKYVYSKRLQVKKPVIIPLIVEDTKVRYLLEYMCQAEITRLLEDG